MTLFPLETLVRCLVAVTSLLVAYATAQPILYIAAGKRPSQALEMNLFLPGEHRCRF